MFVLEAYKKKHAAELAAWKKGRDEWAGGGYYRSRSDYSVRRPGFPWEIFGTTGLIILVVIVFIGLMMLIAKNAPTGYEVDKSPGNPHGCHKAVNKGDKVAVLGGKFDGSKGTVIDQSDNCDVHLTLTESTYSREYCLKNDGPGYCDESKENGSILTVDNSKDVIKL